MATASNKGKSSIIGRPPLPPEKRKRPSMGFRPTTDLREKLEHASATSGLSLTQEVERRLEQSFLDEAALVEAFGGKETYYLLRMLGSVAALIQSRTGKTIDDWETRLAIISAWKRQIPEWMPAPPDEWEAEQAKLLMMDLPKPDAPELPERPRERGLLASPQSENEREADKESRQKYEKDFEAYSIAWAEYEIEFEKFISQKEAYLGKIEALLRKVTADIDKAVRIGDEAIAALRDQE